MEQNINFKFPAFDTALMKHEILHTYVLYKTY